MRNNYKNSNRNPVKVKQLVAYIFSVYTNLNVLQNYGSISIIHYTRYKTPPLDYVKNQSC